MDASKKGHQQYLFPLCPRWFKLETTFSCILILNFGYDDDKDDSDDFDNEDYNVGDILDDDDDDDDDYDDDDNETTITRNDDDDNEDDNDDVVGCGLILQDPGFWSIRHLKSNVFPPKKGGGGGVW